MKNKSLLIVLVGVLSLTLIGVIWGVGVSNSEIKVRNREIAQQKTCEAYFDKLWKILQQKAGVADQYKNSFKEIYIPMIEGRYSQGDGTLMKWVTEHNPNFDNSLYKDLMASIEGERNGFFLEQEKLIDIDRQHKTMRQTFPNSLIIGSRLDIDIKIITSLKTEEVYKSGKEDNIELFK